MIRWSHLALAALLACGPSPSPAPAEATTGGEGDTAGDLADGTTADTFDTSEGIPDPDADTGPQWLSWVGEDVLTVDVFADGTIDCAFRWQTTGIHVAEPCADCDFDFDVTRTPDPGGSTCTGATAGVDRRWISDDRFFIDDLELDDPQLVGDVFVARLYVLDIDPVYGAPVATTREVRATLR